MPIYHIFRFIEKMVQLVDSGLGIRGTYSIVSA